MIAKCILAAALTIGCFLTSSSQTKNLTYSKATAYTIIGKLLPGKNIYHRLDTIDYPDLPKNIKRLLTQSAGMAVCFKTTSNAISARWCVSAIKASANMTAIAAKGLDLYIKKNGKWQFAGVGVPKDKCNEGTLVANLENGDKECLLYLPLYDEVSNVEIGVERGSSIGGIPNPFHRKVLIYGSSILQGASASRAGMAYPARFEMETGLYFLNFGLNGSAKMEKGVADLVASIAADAYILDCVPNSSPQEITERTAYLVKKIRALNPKAPIILVQSIFRELGYLDQAVGKRVTTQNENIEKEFLKLKHEGVKDIYLIASNNMLGNDHLGTVDGTHPNDLGFDRMLKILKPEILSTLKRYSIE